MAVTKDYNLNDFRRNLDQVQKLGMERSLARLPSMSEIVSGNEDPKVALNRIRLIIDAMTPEERCNPEIIDISHRTRIAASAGMEPQHVERFLEQFDQLRGLLRKMANMSLWNRIRLVLRGTKRSGLDAPPPDAPRI